MLLILISTMMIVMSLSSMLITMFVQLINTVDPMFMIPMTKMITIPMMFSQLLQHLIHGEDNVLVSRLDIKIFLRVDHLQRLERG